MVRSPKAIQSDAEAGFVLLAAIFLCVLLLISVAIAAPKMARSIQRDKELETIHRGEQYRRAIQLYYRKFQRYPTSIDQLINTNQMRFLRKKYTDPLTGKDDWKPILFGQAHVRPLGFFGQPLMAMAGMPGTMSSMYAPVAATTDANGVPVAAGDDTSGAAAAGSSSTGGSMFGSSPTTPGTGMGSSPMGSGSMFGSNPSSPMGGSPMGSSPMGGSPMGGSTFGSTSNAPGTGTSATTFGGGGPIVGFTLPVKKPSLIDYMKQTSYNHWEFNYDPAADMAQAMTGIGGGAGAANPNALGQPANNGSTLMSPNTPSSTTDGSTTDGSSSQPQDNSGSQPQ